MSYNLSSRFSDSTIASASSSFSRISCASSVSSVEDLQLPSLSAIPKPPPRTSSITVHSTKTYAERRERKKPAPLTLAPSKKSTRAAQQVYSSSSDDSYFSCSEDARDSYRSRCFCGSVIRPSTSNSTSSSMSIYCSTRCARQDALCALEGRSPASFISMRASPSCSDDEEEDVDFPVTPTNAFVPSPPRSPAGKYRRVEREREPSLTRKMTGLGASHYRRMEALGLYDQETTPTRPSKNCELNKPIDLMVVQSPTGKAIVLPSSLASSDEDDELDLDFEPRKTLFFPIPIYMQPSIHS